MPNPFIPSDTQYTTFEKKFDSDGKVYLKVQSHDALVALTPYGIVANEFGWISQALPAADKYIYVGVNINTVAASGALPWLQIGGYIVDMITASISMAVGEGMTVNSGAIADIAADFTGAAGEFSVATAATTTSTTQTAMLVPERIITI